MEQPDPPTEIADSATLDLMYPANRRTIYGLLKIKTAADKSPAVFQFVLTRGKMALPVFLGGNIVFVLLWLPFWGLSFLLSEYGVYIVCVATVFFFGRLIIRLLAFPGSSSKVSRDIENEFSKYSVRMLDAALTCVIDVCSAIIAQHNKAGNFVYYDVVSLWKRTKSYQDRVLGLFYDVLAYLYQENTSNLGLPPTPKSSAQTTRFGNNRIAGDVGNLATVTSQARADGRSLYILLGKVLVELNNLESRAFGALNPGGDKTISEEAVACARTLLMVAKELRDILSSFKTNTPNTTGFEEEDELTDEENVTGDTIRRTLQTDGGSMMEGVKGAVASILPLLDPPLHSSIFGMDVLRGTVLSRYRGAQQFWVQRPCGGRLDVLHVPSMAWDQSRGRNGKAVMYCNPNAGLCEVAMGMSLSGGNVAPEEEMGDDVCWTDFYISKGYDVYLFNYAGYGRSYGHKSASSTSRTSGIIACISRIVVNAFLSFKPTPTSLRADAAAVGAHLVNVLGVGSLVIHGESIGGMAASGAARILTHLPASKDKIKLLVCDRTFCNLEAVAQRLIGAWTGPAIRMLTFYVWNTDVAGDFLASTCPKVVANDAADAIIADPGSLRGGIAIWKELRREISTSGVGWSMETPLDYRMADFENKGVPSLPPPQWPADKHLSLRESFHFSACARRIGKMASANRRRSRNASGETDHGNDVVEFSPPEGSFVGSDDFSLSGLVRCWQAMSCCDGLCGAPLGSSVKQGNDWTVSWLIGSVVFGGQVVLGAAERRSSETSTLAISSVDFDCRPVGFEREERSGMVHPKPIPEVIETLKAILESGDDSIHPVLSEIKYCVGMFEYIVSRLSSAPVVEESRRGLHFQEKIGSFFDLHCGHNNQFTPYEKTRLAAILLETVGA